MMSMSNDEQGRFMEEHGKDPFYWNRAMAMSCQLERKMGRHLFLQYDGDKHGAGPTVVELTLQDLREATGLRGIQAETRHLERLDESKADAEIENMNEEIDMKNVEDLETPETNVQ